MFNVNIFNAVQFYCSSRHNAQNYSVCSWCKTIISPSYALYKVRVFVFSKPKFSFRVQTIFVSFGMCVLWKMFTRIIWPRTSSRDDPVNWISLQVLRKHKHRGDSVSKFRQAARPVSFDGVVCFYRDRSFRTTLPDV